MNIGVIGLGFVGLTTAMGFSDCGLQVYGYDINNELLEVLRKGEIPFFERGLQEVLDRTRGKSFHIMDNISQIPKDVSAVFFCVGTPCDESGKADLSFLKDAIKSVVEYVDEETLLVIKSTVPPGTVDSIVIPYVKSLKYCNHVAVNPEFLREGYCWSDFTKPDRIVCGIDVNDRKAKSTLQKIYAKFNAPIHFVTPSTAEFIKYLSNCLLANLISFSNEMAEIADAVGGISIGKAFKILHEDNRIKGTGIAQYIYPGCGYGGYCLPKDTKALEQNAIANGVTPNILHSTIALNDEMPQITANKIIQKIGNKDGKIGILGLSFKPNSDDVRDSSAAKIIDSLIKAGYTKIFAYDPVANDNFATVYHLQINYAASIREICENCDTVAIVTAWDEFFNIKQLYPGLNIVDCRYFYD